MSLYPQSQAYGHMAYPAPQGYAQQPHVPAPSVYYPPPPQPTYYVDPNSFRRDYTARLADLTVNSRPIIQNLSMIAQEYSRFAEIVVQCIETHIRRVPPWTKLPSFYLLDAISKNVYEPYARHFTPVVVRLFLDTYEQVDQNTRSKMEEMLLTWRTGAPNGRELFGVVPQVAIERHIWGGDSTNASSSRNGQSSVSSAQVLSELEFVLGQKERTLQTNPYDKVSQNHVTVLHQLRKLVQAGVSQQELGQILSQLRTLAPAPPPVAPPPSHSMPTTHPSYPTAPTYPSQPSVPSANYPAAPQYPSSQQLYPVPSYEQPKTESVVAPNVSSTQSIPTASSASATPAVPVNLSSLFSALAKAGVLSASGTPTGAGQTATPEDNGSQTPAFQPSIEAGRAYRKAILSTGIQLNSNDILRQRPPLARFLYDDLPCQCRQCGLRFPDDSAGKKRMEEHLDVHFKQNRKANQALGRGYSRSWFVSIDDWLQDGSGDVKGKGRADGSRSSYSRAAAAAEAAKRDAELRASFVVVPPGDEAKSISCPICKEPLKTEFNEDDEEWIWRNAVKKDDKIYHATCHAEASLSKSNLASRLKSEVSSRSRSRTPESLLHTPPRVPIPLNEDYVRTSSPSPSRLAGTKRKVEYPVKSEEGTPPMKKAALSAA